MNTATALLMFFALLSLLHTLICVVKAINARTPRLRTAWWTNGALGAFGTVLILHFALTFRGAR